MVWKVGEGDPYALLGSLLLETRGVEPLPPMARMETGKPWFPDYPHLHFSVSHSGGLSLCALGEGPIGADIERVRPRSPGLPRYALDDREQAWFQSRGLWQNNNYIPHPGDIIFFDWDDENSGRMEARIMWGS